MIYFNEDKSVCVRRYRAGWVLLIETKKVATRGKNKGEIITAVSETFHANIRQVSSYLVDHLAATFSEEVGGSVQELVSYLKDSVTNIEKCANQILTAEEKA